MTERIFVTGDWEWVDWLEAYGAAFEAVRLGRPWSGGECPVVTRDVMEAIIARNEWLRHTADGYSDLRMDEAGRVVVRWAEVDEGEEPTVIEPDEDGLYDASFGWTWVSYTEDQLDDADDPIRVMTPIKIRS